MKLLFDENPAPRLVSLLGTEFVSKDIDFFGLGDPLNGSEPRLVWLRTGNFEGRARWES